tara:strand:- start:5677 stop:6075 length:399 start_codon:yes stop_codon:yes gene_type:complete
MKISIFGISYATINIIESVENFSDQIEVFDLNNNFDFNNEISNKKNIKINIDQNLINQPKIIIENSDYVFLASDSDILNSFLYHKFISDFDKNKIQMIILNKDLYEMYKSKNYSVINLFDSTKNEIVDTIRS